MSKLLYAVGAMSFFTNDLVIEFIEANSELEAVKKHSFGLDWLEFSDIEDAKNEAFNGGDMLFDVKEIKNAEV